MSTAERTSAPPLEAGQHLRQPEFHARYHAMPPGVRAELIGGVVIMLDRVTRHHGIVCADAITCLAVYKIRTPGTQASCHATTILGDDNEFHPDCWLRIMPSKGGQSRDAGIYVGGCPELVVEVADSSRSIDLGAKLNAYEQAGAIEYVVFALDPDEVFWHVRQGDRLVRVGPGHDGLYRSIAFPGLWINPAALFADDGLDLVATLDLGLASPEHAAFIAYLAAR